MRRSKYIQWSKLTAVILVLVLIQLMLPLNHVYSADQNWLVGWKYRRKIYVENPTSQSLSNYPVKLVIDTYTLIGQGKLRLDAGDLRFTDWDGVTQLKYWVNKTTVNTGNTEVYVRLSIPAKSYVTIYMYYGNPTATDNSDPFTKPIYPSQIIPISSYADWQQVNVQAYAGSLPIFSLNSTLIGDAIDWRIPKPLNTPVYLLNATTQPLTSNVTLPSGTYTLNVYGYTSMYTLSLTGSFTARLYKRSGFNTVTILASATVTLSFNLDVYTYFTISVPMQLSSSVQVNAGEVLGVDLKATFTTYSSSNWAWYYLSHGNTKLTFPSTVNLAQYGSVNTLYPTRPIYGLYTWQWGGINQWAEYMRFTGYYYKFNVSLTGQIQPNSYSASVGGGINALFNATQNNTVLGSATYTSTTPTTYTLAQNVNVTISNPLSIMGIWRVGSYTGPWEPFIINSLNLQYWDMRYIDNSTYTSIFDYTSRRTYYQHKTMPYNSTHEWYSIPNYKYNVIRYMQSVFPYSVPSIVWDNVRLAWVYTVQTVNVYWVGDETYTPPSQTEQYIIFPNFTVSKYVENWFRVNATWGSINFGNFTDYTRMIAQSTVGRLALTAIPFIILLVAGGHYAGIAILISSAIALVIQLSVKDIVSLFTIPFLGVMMFIGIGIV
ncbi:MAG: DUF2341 domain-containing protein [archaeon YNP-LCB-003-016]|uniref:DUF2341 domain-containing protein n=1 Tax=Candidatus Culexarchaeum yellowstonense TaxID=2928963 RepID=UPI0026EC8B02|nr:DUF2341 domain-containing protein [Candidatus Culexarchaeum yellowstonense]MCR6692298.1 DUF2341 domain-containing protein [Candidatus Culexarchaeum yellowstonense]